MHFIGDHSTIKLTIEKGEENMKKKRLNWKAILITVISIGIVISSGVYAIVQKQEINQEKTDGTFERVQAQIDGLYYDQGKVFLKENLQSSEIEDCEKSIEGLNKYASARKGMKKQLKQVKDRFDIQKVVNDCFEKDEGKNPLNGITLQKYVLDTKALKTSDVEKITKDFEKDLKTDDGFYQTMNKLLDEAKRQLKIYAELEDKIQALKENTSLNYDDVNDKVEDLKAEVEEEENPFFKSRLLERLSEAPEEIVNAITARKEEAARKKHASEQELERIRKRGEEERRRADEERRRLQEEQKRLAAEARRQNEINEAEQRRAEQERKEREERERQEKEQQEKQRQEESIKQEESKKLEESKKQEESKRLKASQEQASSQAASSQASSSQSSKANSQGGNSQSGSTSGPQSTNSITNTVTGGTGTATVTPSTTGNVGPKTNGK